MRIQLEREREHHISCLAVPTYAPGTVLTRAPSIETLKCMQGQRQAVLWDLETRNRKPPESVLTRDVRGLRTPSALFVHHITLPPWSSTSPWGGDCTCRRCLEQRDSAERSRCRCSSNPWIVSHSRRPRMHSRAMPGEEGVLRHKYTLCPGLQPRPTLGGASSLGDPEHLSEASSETKPGTSSAESRQRTPSGSCRN